MDVPDNPEDLIVKFLRLNGEWAWTEVLFVSQVIEPGSSVLDVGAFVGTFGIGLSQAVKLGQLCCVEANPDIFRLLTNNVARNAAASHTIISAMVTGRDGELTVGHGDPGNLGATSYEPTRTDKQIVSTPPIQMTTLKQLRVAHGPFDLIKLDVEGMEGVILRGDSDFLSTGGTSLWLECNETRKSLELIDLILSWSAEVYFFAFPSHNPTNFKGAQEPLLPWSYEGGLLVAPRRVPSLSAELIASGCILRPIHNGDDLRDALWDTPRGLPPNFSRPGIVELAAALSRAERGEIKSTFLQELLSDGSETDTTWARLRRTEAGLAEAQKLAIDRLEEIQVEIVRRENVERALTEATTLALERLGELEIAKERVAAAESSASDLARNLVLERASRAEVEGQLAETAALALERLREIELANERVAAAESSVGELSRELLIERNRAASLEHAVARECWRREELERKVADVAALALERLREIGAAREVVQKLECKLADAEAIASERLRENEAARKVVQELERKLADAEALTSRHLREIALAREAFEMSRDRLSAIQATVVWRLGNKLNHVVGRYRALHAAARFARRIVGRVARRLR